MSSLASLSKPSLLQFWRLHRDECRAIGSIVADARDAKLPGVAELENGHGFQVIDEAAALAAMRRPLQS